MWKRGGSLAVKALIAVLLILLPVIFVFVYNFERMKDDRRRLVLVNLTATAEAYEGLFLAFLQMNTNRVEDFASDGFIRKELKLINNGDKSAVRPLYSHLTLNKIVLDKTLRAIHVVSGKTGKVVVSTDTRAVGRDLSGDEVFIRGKAATYVRDVVIGEGSGTLSVSTPITDVNTGEPLGVLVNVVGIEELDKLLSGTYLVEHKAISAKKGRGDTFEAYIVNRNKVFLTSSIFDAGARLKRVVDTLPVNTCLNESLPLQEREIADYYSDYRGVPVAGVSMCIPTLGWTLVVEMDDAEIMSAFVSVRNQAIVVAGIVVALLLLLYYFFLVYVVRPLYAVAEATDSLAEGNYDVTVPVRTKDEIGRLGESFNSMAAEIRERTRELVRSEASLSNAQQIAHVGNWDWDIVNGTLHWSDEIYRIFGLSPREFKETYEAFLEVVHPDDRQYVIESVNSALKNEAQYRIDHRIVLSDGKIRYVHEQAEVVFDSNNNPLKMAGTVQDITERKRYEFELKKLSSVMEQSINLIFITDVNGRIEYVNPVFEQVTGYAKAEALGKTPRILKSGDKASEDYAEMWEQISAGKTWRGLFKNRRKNGEYYWVNSVVSPIKNDKGEITNFLAIQEDMTERMQTDEVMKYMAFHDELTGLYNRIHFIRLVDEWIVKEGAAGSKGAMMLFDIDQFKLINNTYGHGMGDSVLVRVGKLLEKVLTEIKEEYIKDTPETIASRLSADEFAVFLPGVDASNVERICERIRAAVEEFEPIEISARLTVSIGAAIFPLHGENSRRLLSRSEAASVRAKELGRNRVRVYREEDGVLEEMRDRLKWKEAIINALKNDRFEPWLQPIKNLMNGTITHYEVLARMRDDDGGIVPPAKFIDVGERFGLIKQINMVIIEKAVRLLAEVNKSGKNIAFSINLSGKMIGDDEVLEGIKSILAKYGVAPSRIIFEITETATVHDMKTAIEFTGAIKALGCKFSLDDFGVGFTSFSYLRELSVDYIKIDGSFVRKIHENEKDRLFVKAIADIARGMNIQTVAEFVEDEAALSILRDFGVDYAQGYYVGKPAPFSDTKGLGK